MPTAAVIFDLDDTLAETGNLWRHAEVVLLAAIGQSWNEEVAAKYKGMNSLDVATVIHSHYRPAISRPDAQQILRNVLLDNFAHEPINPMPGAVACVRRAAAKYPIAVASGSPLKAIELALQRLHIRDAFTAIISSESVQRGKPFPDVYLHAASVLNVDPTQCVAIEDSAIGARSAYDAGMNCFLIPSNSQACSVVLEGVQIANSLDGLFVE
jgi:HAD superfamily hydrolase (TIGR01509 family)